MHNCIFSGHCFDYSKCDNSCPALAQTSYLLERNDISMNSPVFSMSDEELARVNSILKQSDGQVRSVFESYSTNKLADEITYVSICNKWKGSRLHCTVYNLKLSSYIQQIQNSWTNGSSSDMDYMKIWISSADILVISNIDFINFKDFPCQTLLSLLQSRERPGLTTIIVSPPTSSLVGEGPFFGRLLELLNRNKVV